MFYQFHRHGDISQSQMPGQLTFAHGHGPWDVSDGPLCVSALHSGNMIQHSDYRSSKSTNKTESIQNDKAIPPQTYKIKRFMEGVDSLTPSIL